MADTLPAEGILNNLRNVVQALALPGPVSDSERVQLYHRILTVLDQATHLRQASVNASPASFQATARRMLS